MRQTMTFIAYILGMIINAFEAGSQSVTPLPYLSDPAISPDAREIAFVNGGDIWTVAAAGGEARLLISNPATESRPVYSPDGKSIAFNSSRTGNGDVYVFNMDNGKTTRITYDDGLDEVSAWSKDGKYLYFASTSRDISGMRDVYRIKSTGGTPMMVSDHRYVSEFQASPSPDGQTTALVARGVGSTQWWRNGSSHLDESELWVMNAGNNSYSKIMDRGARQLWPMWSADGKNIYFISDRNGKENIWKLPVGGSAKQLTSFNTGRVLWPSIAANEEAIVFERDFSIWTYNIKKDEAKKLSISLKGTPATPLVEHSRLTTGFNELAISPDNKKLAFVARGELFVAGVKDGGDASRVTITDGNESQPVWSANSNAIYFLSDRDGSTRIYKYDFITNKESQLTGDNGKDASPLLSPDGKSIAFIRNFKELRILDLASNKETLVAKGFLGTPPFSPSGSVAWSPDSKWLAYGGFGPKALFNVYVVSATGGESRQISFLGNSFGGNVFWSKDGRSVYYATSQRTEDTYIAKIDLVPQQPKFREDQFRDLFVEPPADKTTQPKKDTSSNVTGDKSIIPPKSNSPVRIVWEGIRERLNWVPVGVDVNDYLVSKDGNTIVLVATAAGQQNIYSYSLDELSRDAGVLRQITTSPGGKRDIQISNDGKEVYYFESGRIHTVSLESKSARPISVTAEMDIDFSKEKMEMFKQAWDSQNEGFYDEKFHGKDWAAIKRIYEPYAAGAQTGDELRRLLNLMVGELDASHSGVGGPAGPQLVTGRTGLRFDRLVYESEGKFRITEVVAFSPAALSEQIKVGDYLLAVDGKQLNANTNLDQQLENKTGKKTVLTIGSTGNGSNSREVTIRPISNQTEKGLLYKQWVSQQREYVAKVSKGRLGYVHMFDMGQGSLDQLYLDMDAENHAKDGVVVDVRNNNGGFVNAYALDVLSRKGYMNMQRRGIPVAPARVQLGQRALDAPTVLVTNQHSLSDAEDFTEGYRELKLGKTVGEPTSGWIIYTGSVGLIDGSTVRMPFIKITDSKGNNMELEPRPVDIPVSNPLGEKNSDRQLDTAVKVLLEQIGKR